MSSNIKVPYQVKSKIDNKFFVKDHLYKVQIYDPEYNIFNLISKQNYVIIFNNTEEEFLKKFELV